MDVRQVRRVFAAGEPGEVTVLDGVDLAVARGESVAVVGPSGSGKSTLLNLMGGLDRPTSGTVRFEGRPLESMSDEELGHYRNRSVGFVFQLHHLLPQCTVLENTLVPTLVAGAPVSGAEAESRARALLTRVGLNERLAHLPGQLSGGERQRVAVVRALIHHPALLLADEPTGSLDQDASRTLTELLLALNEELGTTLVVVTHAEGLAGRLGRTVRLTGGCLVSEGRSEVEEAAS